LQLHITGRHLAIIATFQKLCDTIIAVAIAIVQYYGIIAQP